jgi:hypothetical protein
MEWTMLVLKANIHKGHDEEKDIHVVLEPSEIGYPPLGHELFPLVPDRVEGGKGKQHEHVGLLLAFVDVGKLDIQANAENVEAVVREPDGMMVAPVLRPLVLNHLSYFLSLEDSNIV